MSDPSGQRPHPALVMALAATGLVQAGTLTAGLHDDDYLHLFGLASRPFFEFVFATFGGHIMVLPKLVMWAMHAAFGASGGPYMILALSTHLLNVALIHRVAVRFGGTPWVVGAVVLLWGTAPMQQSTLSWMSTYGFILGTTTTLLALNELGRARSEGRGLRAAEVVRANLFVAAGGLSLGAAATVALVFPLVAWLLAPPEASPHRTALFMAPAWLAMVGVLSVVDSPLISLQPLAVATLFTHLVAYGLAAVFAGPLATASDRGVGLLLGAPEDLASPLSFGIAACVVAVLVRDVLRTDRRTRRTTAGFLVLSAAVYGAIAAGRAIALAMFLVSTLAMQDRYHYAPTIGVVIACALALSRLRPSDWVPARRTLIALASGCALVTLASVPVALRHRTRETATWAREHAHLTEDAIAAVVAAQPPGDVYLRNDDFFPALLVVKMAGKRSDFPGIGAYWAVTHGSSELVGHRLHFVDDDPQVEQALPRMRPAVRALFVAPADAARSGAPIHSLDESPPALRDELQHSVDPVLARAMARELRLRAAPH